VKLVRPLRAGQHVSVTNSRFQLSRYLTLALEFQLSSDVLGTAIAPSWTAIGKLAAIGAIQFVSGSTASSHLSAGAIIEFGPGEVLSNVNVGGGTTLEVLAGGSDLGGTIGSRGTLIVGPGGFDFGTTVRKGGTESVLSGGTALNVSVTGGALHPGEREAADRQIGNRQHARDEYRQCDHHAGDPFVAW